MFIPRNKTKIVCTIGPRSNSEEMLEALMNVGMNVARLNFSHGDLDAHGLLIQRIKRVRKRVGMPVAIMADLPGPKMRIGTFEREPVTLQQGGSFLLTTKDVIGDEERVSISTEWLPGAVRSGQHIFLNDGLIELEVKEVQGHEIVCEVLVGGELRSKKGMNIPGLELTQSAFTVRDSECLKFALEQGVDAVSQSFVSRAEDVISVRNAARSMGFDPYIIAKIERATVLERIDEVIDVSDGVMVARGDLGVEIPIYEIAVVQKCITWRAHARGKAVITATQMLESMTHNRRPTRAEATDVANAIFDGTDAVMLSEESAMGDYPIEATSMLSKIAIATEPHMERPKFKWMVRDLGGWHGEFTTPLDSIAEALDNMVDTLGVAAVICPTESGHTARSVTRFRLPCWILAVTDSVKTCRDLMFSFGVWPVLEHGKPIESGNSARRLVKEAGLVGEYVLLTEGPSASHPDVDHRLEVIKLKEKSSKGGPYVTGTEKVWKEGRGCQKEEGNYK